MSTTRESFYSNVLTSLNNQSKLYSDHFEGIKNELLLTQNDNLRISNTFSASKSILDGLCVKLNLEDMGICINKIKSSAEQYDKLSSDIESIITRWNEFTKKNDELKHKNEAAHVEYQRLKFELDNILAE